MKTGPRLVLVLLCVQTLSGCRSSSVKDNTYREGKAAPQTLVDEKYSLAEDRKQLEELRQQVPAEQRTKNDELAFVLNLLSEVKRPPSEIRNRFDSAVRKRRDLFNKDAGREREDFTKQERKKREDFLAEQKKNRDEFLVLKPKKDERDEFFQRSEEKRKSFFQNEREKRSDFESDMRERRKSFEDYVREKTDAFNQELRSYSKKYDEMRKRERETQQQTQSKGASWQRPNTSDEVKSLEAELLEGMGIPATALESGQ